MKKKLLQEQKERAIIESFAKTFNKIKRLDENPLGKEKDRIEHLAATSSSTMPYLMRELYNKYDADLDAPCVTFSSDSGYQEWDSLEELLNSISDYVVAGDDRKAAEIYKTDMQHLNGTSDTGIKLGLETGMSYKATISWAKYANGMFQGADYIEIYQDTNETPTEQPVDEINLKKGLATLGLAGAMMLPSKDSAAQNQMSQQQGIETSIDSAQALGLPKNNRKAGKIVMDSYTKNPFTADMWSKKSRENLRFFKTVKKLVDYYSAGGQVDDSDIEELGAMAQQSPVAMDFLQRKKEDATTSRLEENINIHDKYTPLQQIYSAFNKLEKNDFHGWFNTYRNDLLKKEKNLIAVTYNQAFSNGAYDAKGDPSKYEDGEDYYNKNFGQ